MRACYSKLVKPAEMALPFYVMCALNVSTAKCFKIALRHFGIVIT